MNEGESSSKKWAVCPCNVCSGRLEFDPANAGETIQCPHCGMETVLFIPPVSTSPPLIKVPASTPNQTSEIISPSGPVLATTANEISGYSIGSYRGIARGIVVRSPNIVQGVLGGFKQIVGGNIESYAIVCEQARREAFSRMISQAKDLGADAVIAFRYDATEFAPGITEVLAYGTAVKLVANKP
ncbi:MAG TPA: YbjQ family protein [Verrucomicrobiae bacterium]|jgi:uncharacterized protein YbjQ (UPF0145 family)|nr:YbjQ family protein [Verrucomicrobiae bacterium]